MRGFTLFEALVACALTVLAFGLIAAFLVPTLRAQARGTARAELEQAAVLVLNRIESDLRMSASAATSLRVSPGSPAPVVLGLRRVDSLQGDATPTWEPRVVAYWWDRAQKQVLRRECPPAPPTPPALSPTLPSRLTAGELAQLASAPDNGTRRVLARAVEDFEVSHRNGTASSVIDPITIRIQMRRNVSGLKQPIRFELSRTVSFRNGL
ncbi:MAG: hypothetical protein AB1758_08570 [Candidatus Eremiobacterota bacterium]